MAAMSERLDNIAGELLALLDKQGRINADEAVEWARKHPRSQLHASLTWDDKVAAERHRIWQVRQLIAIHIVDADGGRKFVSLSIDRGSGGGGYRPMSDVVASSDLREVMLADALAELERLQKRYSRLQELSAVWASVAKVGIKSKIKPVKDAG